MHNMSAILQCVFFVMCLNFALFSDEFFLSDLKRISEVGLWLCQLNGQSETLHLEGVFFDILGSMLICCLETKTPRLHSHAFIINPKLLPAAS